MKRSRLKLFKTTSLTISLIGIILIILTIIVVAYVGVSGVSNSVSHSVSSGSAYDQLDQLKAEYGNVSAQYDELNNRLGTNPDPGVKTTFNTGKVKLSEVGQQLSSIQNDINNGKSDEDIQYKINQTKNSLNEVKDIYNQIA